MRWSEAGYLSRIVLAHAPRQASVSLILSVRQKIMSIPKFNLVVIRSPDIEVSHRFYSALGFTFEKHAHGSGPIHYASEQNGYVFEIYPVTPKEDRSTGIRIGIEVSDIVASIEAAKNSGALKASAPKDSDWGIMAIVEDPFGIPVHFIQKIKDEK